GRVDHAQRIDAVILELADDRLGQRLERAGEHDALLRVDRVLDEDQRRDVVAVEELLRLEILDLVEQREQVDVGSESKRAEQRRDKKLPAAAAAVEVNVEQVVVVELHLE